MAELLTDPFRSDDQVARLEVDKFGVLLSNTSSVSFEAVQTRVQYRLANYNQQHPGVPMVITLSIVSAKNGQPLHETVLAAEKRLADTNSSR